MSFLPKTRSLLLIGFITALLSAILYWGLSWPAPIEFIPTIKSGTLTIEQTLENGETQTQTINLADTKFALRVYRVTEIKFWSSIPENEILVKIQNDSASFIGEGKVQNKRAKISGGILKSVVLVPLTIILTIYFCLEGLRRCSRKEQLMVLGTFLVHFGVLLTLYFLHAPGFVDYDTFASFEGAAKYHLSSFTGTLYSSFVMIGLELFNHPGFLTLTIAVSIALCQTVLFRYALSAKMGHIYWCCWLCFILIPSHAIMSVYASREAISHWMLVLTIITFQVNLLGRTQRFLTPFFMFLVMITCLLRPEMKFLLLPALLLLGWFKMRSELRPIALFCLSLFFLDFVVNRNAPSLRTPRAEYVYSTTLLINPLGSILSTKYGNELPESVDKKLGPYFKNDYLVKYHQEDDIYPFHKGGVDQASYENFIQFRNASLKIFFENPILFIKNRLNVAKMMLGWTANDNFKAAPYNHSYPYADYVKSSLHFPPLPPTSTYLVNLYWKHSGVFKNYAFPLLILLIMGLSIRKWSWFHLCIGILVARLLLVILTAPAIYYNYNYVLWIFAFFGLPFMLWEKRLRQESLTP